MPRYNHTVILSDEARRHALRVDNARHKIPLNVYLAAVHEAICTGVFPDFDPNTGNRVPSATGSVLSPELRVDLTKWMVNLAMPSLKSVAPPQAEDVEAAVTEAGTEGDAADTIRNLTTTQLKATLNALTKPLASDEAATTRPPQSPAN